MGKSTLVNALIPDADRAVGTVSPVTGRGRHTSSSAVALALPGGGWIIDTPGAARVRARLRHPGPGGARVHRPGPGHGRVPARLHHDLEPDCALDSWVRDQGDDPRLAARLDSLRRLLRSRDGAEAW